MNGRTRMFWDAAHPKTEIDSVRWQVDPHVIDETVSCNGPSGDCSKIDERQYLTAGRSLPKPLSSRRISDTSEVQR